MPKQTFFNLPQEKRLIIEQAALDEFSEYGFDNSNMNRIVAQSRIAKGSFYQYFEDKKDLYFHLVDTLVTRKMESLGPVLGAMTHNSFSFNLEEIFRVGLEFADSDPKYFLLGEDFAGKQPSFIGEFFEKYSPVGINIYEKLLESAREAGELREEVDIALTSSFINSLINQTSAELIGSAARKGQRSSVVRELLAFIERAVLQKGI